MDFEFIYGEIKPSAVSCLAFKWQEPQAPDRGDAAPRCGPGGEHVPGGYLPEQQWPCLRPPPRTDVTSRACFLLLLSHPLTAGETEAQGDSVHPEQWEGKGSVWVVGRRRSAWSRLWGPTEGHLGFNVFDVGSEGMG